MKCPNCAKSLWFLKTFCPFCQTAIAPTPRARRPASVIVTMVVFALGSGFGLWLIGLGFGDRGVMVRVALMVTALLGLVFFGRSRVTFWLTAAALGALVLRSAHSAVDALGQQPFVRLDSPYHMGASLGTILAVVGTPCLFLWFVLGRSSREFFGIAGERSRPTTSGFDAGESGGVR